MGGKVRGEELFVSYVYLGPQMVDGEVAGQ